jgi:hypothetical protein
MVLLERELYRLFEEYQEAKERLVIKRGDRKGGLYALGFEDTINIDGVDVTQEFGVPTAVGYGLAVEHLELCSLQGQLFVPRCRTSTSPPTATASRSTSSATCAANPRSRASSPATRKTPERGGFSRWLATRIPPSTGGRRSTAARRSTRTTWAAPTWRVLSGSSRTSTTACTGATKPKRTNRRVRCRCVRNVAAAALLPKRLVTFQKSGVYYGARVDGYLTTVGDRGFPVDEFLPAAGVPVNDLFWIVVRGPATVLTDLASLGATITVGDAVLGQTAVTSGATTAGRVIPLPGATSGSTLQNEVINRVGYALSAKTTNNTNADLLVEVGPVL